jgi:hypothetical protein
MEISKTDKDPEPEGFEELILWIFIGREFQTRDKFHTKIIILEGLANRSVEKMQETGKYKKTKTNTLSPDGPPM